MKFKRLHGSTAVLIATVIFLFQNCSNHSFEILDSASENVEVNASGGAASEITEGAETSTQTSTETLTQTATSIQTSSNTATDTSTVSNISVTLDRPLSFEVVDLTTGSLPLSASILGEQKVVTYQILNGANLLQNGVVQLSSVLKETNISLNAAVKSHRGSFLTLKVGSTTRQFGVGFSFLVAGQSNTVSSGCRDCANNIYSSNNQNVVILADSKVDPRISNKSKDQILFPATISERVKASEMQYVPMSETPVVVQGANKIVWRVVGERLSQEFNVPVSFIVVGVGGTSTLEWSNTYKRLFEYGSRSKLTAVLWHQGESDAIDKISYSNHKIALSNLIDYSRQKIGNQVSWMIARASFFVYQEFGGAFGGRDAEMEAIEKAQDDFILSQAPGNKVYGGPNSNQIPHRGHFDTMVQFHAFADSWITQLKSSGILGGSAPKSGVSTFNPRRGLNPIYRSFKSSTSDHLFSFSQGEGDSHGFAREGLVFKLFKPSSNRGTNLKKIYRCLDEGINQHFLSVNSSCEGKKSEGEMGEIYANALPINVDPLENKDIYLYKPLYFCRGPNLYFATTAITECDGSWFDSRNIVGYVPYEYGD